MDHYLDIRLRPDQETAPSQLLSALFTKLHHALARGQHKHIGVSFPEASEPSTSPPAPRTLGAHLRLHGSHADLHRLMEGPWLVGLRDHINLGDVKPAPANARHRTVGRVQVKSSPERLRRRLQRRHGLDAAEAQQRIPDAVAQTLALPFVTLSSTSTAQRFHLFIRQGRPEAQAVEGEFSTYGLSTIATVPWF